MSSGGDEIWKRREVRSPCVKICVIHPEAGLCTGCLRTAAEIAEWSRMSDDRRAEILEELPTRRPQLAVRRGGRAGRMKRRGG